LRLQSTCRGQDLETGACDWSFAPEASVTPRAERPCTLQPLSKVCAARIFLKVHRAVAASLGRDLFSSPALEMMLDLYTREEHRPVSLKTLCGAASAPPRTALFTINRLVARRLLSRQPDPTDGRRTNVELTAAGYRLLDECFEEILGIVGRE
jgi:DNA-binding MarR family transcriptional regulator